MVEITASDTDARAERAALQGPEPKRPGAKPTASGTYTATPGARPQTPAAEPRPEPPRVVVPSGLDLPSGARSPQVQPRPMPEPKPTPRVEAPKPAPAPKAESPRPAPAPTPRPAAPAPERSAPAPRTAKPEPVTVAPSAGENAQLASEVAELKKMMSQVLQSARQTAVAVGQSGAKVVPGASSGPLFDLYARLIDQDVDADIAEDLAAMVRDELDADELADAQIVRETMLRRIADMIPIKLDRPASNAQNRDATAGPRRVALIGPTGVGKTTTVAKLAASYKLRYGINVGLVTIDTYRIAAVEQLRTYASIIGLPIVVVNTPDEMRKAVSELRECDAVFIDTAGRSQNDAGRLGELSEFIKAADPDETHLVMSSTASVNTLTRIAERFMPLGPDRVLLTKLDEAVTFGVVVGLCRRVGLPLSFVTTGQEVPDHIEPARPDRLARLVLDGPKSDAPAGGPTP
ncbi:MAG: hypothetical protein DHS20C14_15830 [Phycisphaeraceae bacterium]|nr:MAG: hypothetical protein DHS20C14_15830 [Phycisphaeraceae bacterium]